MEMVKHPFLSFSLCKDWNIRRPLCLDGGARQRRNVVAVFCETFARAADALLLCDLVRPKMTLGTF